MLILRVKTIIKERDNTVAALLQDILPKKLCESLSLTSSTTGDRVFLRVFNFRNSKMSVNLSAYLAYFSVRNY